MTNSISFPTLESINLQETQYLEGNGRLEDNRSLVENIELFGKSFIGSLAATVADSFTIDQDISTEDAISYIFDDQDAISFYEDNKSLVEFSTFVGGIGISGFATFKLLKAMRAGRLNFAGGKHFRKENLNIIRQQRSLRNEGQRSPQDIPRKQKMSIRAALTRTTENSSTYKAMRDKLKGMQFKADLKEQALYEANFMLAMNGHEWIDGHYGVDTFALSMIIGVGAAGITTHLAMRRVDVMNQQYMSNILARNFGEGGKLEEAVPSPIRTVEEGLTTSQFKTSKGDVLGFLTLLTKNAVKAKEENVLEISKMREQAIADGINPDLAIDSLTPMQRQTRLKVENPEIEKRLDDMILTNQTRQGEAVVDIMSGTLKKRTKNFNDSINKAEEGTLARKSKEDKAVNDRLNAPVLGADQMLYKVVEDGLESGKSSLHGVDVIYPHSVDSKAHSLYSRDNSLFLRTEDVVVQTKRKNNKGQLAKPKKVKRVSLSANASLSNKRDLIFSLLSENIVAQPLTKTLPNGQRIQQNFFEDLYLDALSRNDKELKKLISQDLAKDDAFLDALIPSQNIANNLSTGSNSTMKITTSLAENDTVLTIHMPSAHMMLDNKGSGLSRTLTLDDGTRVSDKRIRESTNRIVSSIIISNRDKEIVFEFGHGGADFVALLNQNIKAIDSGIADDFTTISQLIQDGKYLSVDEIMDDAAKFSDNALAVLSSKPVLYNRKASKAVANEAGASHLLVNEVNSVSAVEHAMIAQASDDPLFRINPNDFRDKSGDLTEILTDNFFFGLDSNRRISTLNASKQYYNAFGGVRRLLNSNNSQINVAHTDLPRLQALLTALRSGDEFKAIKEGYQIKLHGIEGSPFSQSIDLSYPSAAIESLQNAVDNITMHYIVKNLDIRSPSGIKIGRKGYNSEQLAIILNMPKETVEAYFAYLLQITARQTGTKSKSVATQAALLDNITDETFLLAGTKKVLNAEPETLRALPRQVINEIDDQDLFTRLSQPTLSLQGSAFRKAEWQTLREHQQISRQDAIRIEKQYIEHVATTGTPVTREIYDELVVHDRGQIIENNIWHTISDITQTNATFSSTDHAIRHLDDVNGLGAVLKTSADTFVNIANRTIKSWIKGGDDTGEKGLIAVWNKVANDTASRVQFSHIINSLNQVGKETGRDLAVVRVGNQMKIATKFDDEGNPTSFLKYTIGEIGVGTAGQRSGVGEDIVLNNNMKNLFEEWLPIQQNLMGLLNDNRRLAGKQVQEGRGLWFPFYPLHSKFRAYVIDFEKGTSSTRLIVANTKDELADLIDKSKKKYFDGGQSDKVRVFTPEQVDEFNDIMNQTLLDPLRKVDYTMPKGGQGLEQIDVTPEFMNDMLLSLQDEIWNQLRFSYTRQNSQVFEILRLGEKHFRTTETGNTLTNHAVRSQDRISAPEMISRMLLNESRVGRTTAFSTMNDGWSWVVSNLAHTVYNGFAKVGEAANMTLHGKLPKDIFEKEYDDMVKQLNDSNIPVPFSDLSEFIILQSTSKKDISHKTVSKFNAFFVTLNLRLMDMAHAAVTTLSSPILLHAELSANKQNYPLKDMYDATRMMFTQEGKDILEEANHRGATKRTVAELTDMLQEVSLKSNLFDRISNNETLTKSVNWLSKASDLSEEYTRKYAYIIGYNMAKKRYKGKDAVSDAIYHDHAQHFTARVMGNYQSRQRPTIFQGTLGATIGLYQTFMLTLMQNSYRYMEKGNIRAMGSLFLGQAGMFGLNALPLYNQVNHAIGAYYNREDHKDINWLANEIFGGDDGERSFMAEWLLYGAPSVIFDTALYTRAEWNFRSPVNAEQGGIGFVPPVIQQGYQTYAFGSDMIQRYYNSLSANAVGATNFARPALEAIAGQSLWRPAARLSELALGYSQNRAGHIVARGDEGTDFDIFSETLKSEKREDYTWSALSRVFATRTLNEQILRELRYSKDYYNTIDKGRRQELIRELRSNLINGTSNPAIMSNTIRRYVQAGGSYDGVDEAINNVYLDLGQTYGDKMYADIKHDDALADLIENYR